MTFVPPFRTRSLSFAFGLIQEQREPKGLPRYLIRPIPPTGVGWLIR